MISIPHDFSKRDPRNYESYLSSGERKGLTNLEPLILRHRCSAVSVELSLRAAVGWPFVGP